MQLWPHEPRDALQYKLSTHYAVLTRRDLTWRHSSLRLRLGSDVRCTHRADSHPCRQKSSQAISAIQAAPDPAPRPLQCLLPGRAVYACSSLHDTTLTIQIMEHMRYYSAS